jgi:hypothetical protein
MQGAVPSQHVETACRLGYVGVRGDETAARTAESMGVSLGYRCSRLCCLGRRVPNTDAVHANASVQAEKA